MAIQRNIVQIPALVDLHVHFREPGFSYKETIQTGSMAAAASGYSAVFTMPNLNPVPDTWDSAGKNTGVGCYFLFQSMKMKSESEVAQLCPTPSDPMGCSLPGSSVHGIFQASRNNI